MKVLVTGGAGFIGSHIVDECIATGYEVVVLDNLSKGKKEQVHPQAAFYDIDITSSKINDVFDEHRPDYMIHHAAQSAVTVSIKDPILDGQANIIGTINLLEAARKHGVKKVIYASSAAVYGEPQYMGLDEEHPKDPLSPYGISKYVAELYIQNFGKLYGLPYTIFRYANIYGERQDPEGEGGVISIFTDRAIRGTELTINGDGEHTRDFVYVKDVVTANMRALKEGDDQTFNVGTNHPTSLNQLVETLNKVLGKTLNVKRAEPREGDIVHSYLNNERIQQALNWKPQYALEEGLKQMFKAIDKN